MQYLPTVTYLNLHFYLCRPLVPFYYVDSVNHYQFYNVQGLNVWHGLLNSPPFPNHAPVHAPAPFSSPGRTPARMRCSASRCVYTADCPCPVPPSIEVNCPRATHDDHWSERPVTAAGATRPRHADLTLGRARQGKCGRPRTI